MFNSDNAREYGRKGGMATAQRHGRSHLSKIGRKGFEATTERHFQGDEEKHKSFLREQCGWNYYVQTGVALKHDVTGKPIWRKPTHPAHMDDDPIPF